MHSSRSLCSFALGMEPVSLKMLWNVQQKTLQNPILYFDHHTVSMSYLIFSRKSTASHNYLQQNNLKNKDFSLSTIKQKWHKTLRDQQSHFILDKRTLRFLPTCMNVWQFTTTGSFTMPLTTSIMLEKSDAAISFALFFTKSTNATLSKIFHPS